MTTDRPDQYLNSIVHCIEKGIQKIVFVQVDDTRMEQINLNSLSTSVYNLLKDLSKGFYRYYTGDLKDQTVQLNTEYNIEEIASLKAKYGFCLSDSINWSVKRVAYLDLRVFMSSLSTGKDIIVDVTAISKVYMGDILACSLLEGIDGIYTFELLDKPNFDKPWQTLIHDLEAKKAYRYTNLVETSIFKESRKSILIRTTPLRASIIGAVLCICIAIVATFFFGANSVFVQILNIIGTVLGIISFVLIYFPVRAK